MLRNLILAVAASTAMLGCSGAKGANPTAPTPAPTAASVTSLDVSGPIQVTMGQSAQLVATARYSDGASRDMSATATWTSSDTTVAEVRGGLVTGLFAGTVSISAQLGEARGTATVGVVTAFTPGIVFGPGVSAIDQEMVRSAHSINERFWGPLGTTVLAYATIAEVVAAYEALCRCVTSAQRRLELEHEAMTSTPNVLLVALDTFWRFPSSQKTERLVHSEFHSVQKGYTGGRVDPTWFAEGSAEYSQVHAMGNAGLVNVDQYHQWIRQGSVGYPQGLRDLETWAVNPLAPDGCMATGSCSAPYLLGHFAIDLLTVRMNRTSVLAFWRETGTNLRRGMSPDTAWRSALGSVFEISVDEFYSAFEAYRRRGFR